MLPAVGLLAGLAAFFWFQGQENRTPKGLDGVGLQEEVVHEGPSEEEVELQGGPVEGPPKGREQVQVAEPKALDPARAPVPRKAGAVRWLEGRVVFPEGTPLDEKLEVEARGGVFAGSEPKRRRHRVSVAPDGTFRVAVAKDTRKARLLVFGQYCRLVEPFVWSAKDPSEIELWPGLGVAVDVQLVGPEVMDGLEAKVVSYWLDDFKSLELLKGNRLELRAFPTDAGGNLVITLPGYARHEERLNPGGEDLLLPTLEGEMNPSQAKEVWEPGTRVAITVELKPEARVVGTLVLEGGETLSEGVLAIRKAAQGDSFFAMEADQTAQWEDGRFEFAALPAGDYVIEYRSTGYLVEDKKVSNLKEGETRQVEIQARTGMVLAGKVTWASGDPAQGVEVKLLGKDLSIFDEPGGPLSSVTTDENGDFAFTGFEKVGEWDVLATGIPPGMKPPEGSSKIKLRRWKRKHEVFARKNGVRPGNVPVNLVLGAETAEIVGRVEDDRGQPVERFRISARPEWALDNSTSAGQLRESFHAKDGRFRMSNVPVGKWWVSAGAKGYREGKPQEVELPTDQELVFRLPRASSLKGWVVDHEGKKVEARVYLYRGQQTEEWEDWTESSEVSGFSFPAIDAGTYALEAQLEGHGNSNRLEVQLELGQRLDDLELRLPKPGRLVGSVHSDWWGGSLAVELHLREGTDSEYYGRYEVDAAGAFTVDPLSVGSYSADLIRTTPDGADLGTGMVKAVHIYAGETTSVRFGPIPQDAIVLRGRVLRGTVPLANHRVEMDHEVRQEVGAMTNGAGEYHLALLEPGSYRIKVSDPAGGWGGSVWTQEIQGSGAQTLDLVIPSNRLRVKVELQGAGPFPGDLSAFHLSLDPMHSDLNVDGESHRDHFLVNHLGAGSYFIEAPALIWNGQHFISSGPGEVEIKDQPDIQEVVLTYGLRCALDIQVEGVSDEDDVYVYLYTSEQGDDWQDLEYVLYGMANFEGLTPGDYWVALEVDDEKGERTKVTVAPGARGTMTLRP